MDFNTFKEDVRYKAKNFSQSVKNGITDAIEYAEQHPLAASIMTTIAIKGFTAAAQAQKAHRVHVEERKRNERIAMEQLLKECNIYDNSAGVYLETVRPMTKAERTEYSVRRHAQEKPVDILRSMNLL